MDAQPLDRSLQTSQVSEVYEGFQFHWNLHPKKRPRPVPGTRSAMVKSGVTVSSMHTEGGGFPGDVAIVSCGR